MPSLHYGSFLPNTTCGYIRRKLYIKINGVGYNINLSDSEMLPQEMCFVCIPKQN